MPACVYSISSGGRMRLFFAVVLCQKVLASITTADARKVNINTEISCDKILSQRHYSLSDMSGSWYGIEILEHVTRNRPAVDSCIKIELRPRDGNYVDLIWREHDFRVDYKFVILDQNQRGNWTSQGQQAVSGKPEGYTYEQFAGNVFIVKASDTNVVLTFCSSPNKLYSLVLSKSYYMNGTELASLHGTIHRMGVPVPVDVKKYCRNRGIATTSESSFLLSIVASFAIIFTILI